MITSYSLELMLGIPQGTLIDLETTGLDANHDEIVLLGYIQGSRLEIVCRSSDEEAVKTTHFEWDEDKDKENQTKHGVSFVLAQHAFLDPHRVIAQDLTHGGDEERFYCIGRIGDDIMTVRFTYRGEVIRIYGAGYWRKGRKIYEEQNKIY